MPVIRFAALVLFLGLLGFGSTAFAQAGASQDKSLLDRLDDFGKSIFDVILPVEKTKESKDKDIATLKSDQQSSARQPAWVQPPDDANGSPRAGSILSGNSRTSPPIGCGQVGPCQFRTSSCGHCANDARCRSHGS